MKNYVYGIGAVIVIFLTLALMQLWGVIAIAGDTWAKLTGSAVLIVCILLVLVGVRHFQEERGDSDKDNLISY